jgi:predicted enzyme related to lactoylglutathione lyase
MNAPQALSVLAVYGLRNTADESRLKALIATHHTTLIEEKLAKVQAPRVLRSGNAFVESIEWVSEEASKKAHENARVQKLWTEMAEIVDFLPLTALVNATTPFPAFQKVEIELKRSVELSDFMMSAKNFEELVGFYEKNCGLVVESKNGGFAMLVDPSTALLLCITNGTSIGRPGPGLLVKNLAVSLESLKGQGAKVIKTWEYERMIGANIEDPEGNEVLVYQMKQAPAAGALS